jgi:uncharacterized membrane protein YtjA (UPF0391 family)
MLRWALTFFIFSLVSAIFGFGGIAATTSEIAKILFYVFIVLFVLSLMKGLARKGDNIINKNL